MWKVNVYIDLAEFCYKGWFLNYSKAKYNLLFKKRRKNYVMNVSNRFAMIKYLFKAELLNLLNAK